MTHGRHIDRCDLPRPSWWRRGRIFGCDCGKAWRVVLKASWGESYWGYEPWPSQEGDK